MPLVEIINDNGVMAILIYWAVISAVDVMPKPGERGAPNTWWYAWIRASLVGMTGQVRSMLKRHRTGS